jgi:hypothetical protein
MSLGSQFRQITRQASAFRQDAFGTDDAGKKVTVDYNRGEFPAIEAYYSPFKHQQKTGDAAVWDRFDGVVRIPKATAPSNFVPALNKQLGVTEATGTETKKFDLTVLAIGGTHPVSAEWILGCNALN